MDRRQRRREGRGKGEEVQQQNPRYYKCQGLERWGREGSYEDRVASEVEVSQKEGDPGGQTNKALWGGNDQLQEILLRNQICGHLKLINVFGKMEFSGNLEKVLVSSWGKSQSPVVWRENGRWGSKDKEQWCYFQVLW